MPLSLLAADVQNAGVLPSDVKAGRTYVLGKVRFLAPVISGFEITASYRISAADNKGEGRLFVTIECSLGVVGSEMTAGIAELLAMVIE